MTRIATVLHISDLHFVEELTTEGRRLGRKTRTLLAKSHSFIKLREFNRAISDIQRGGKQFDFILGTGDLTTDGSQEAFKTALEFFEKDRIFRGQPERLIAFGLNVNKDRRLLLPGNHDRYGGKRIPGQRLNNTFETVLNTPSSYPYSVGYRRPSLEGASLQPTLLFFVFDSTPPPTVKFWRWDRIARGHITSAECDWLEDEAKRLVANRRVKGLNGEWFDFDPSRCIRIAVLHHHPVVDEEKAESFKCKLEYMENYETFVKDCFRTGINAVLFGHQHLQYRLQEPIPTGINSTPFGKPNDLYFLCCPSTLEYKEEKNGFYLLDFYEDQLCVALYEWNGNTFKLNEKESGCAPF